LDERVEVGVIQYGATTWLMKIGGEGSFDILCNLATAIFPEMFENFSHSRPHNLVTSTRTLHFSCETLGTRTMMIVEGSDDGV
jgi:hypothetical protein